MKKYLLATSAASAVLALSQPVLADQKIAKLFGGISFFDDQSVIFATSSNTGSSAGTLTGTFRYLTNNHTHTQGTSNVGQHYWYINGTTLRRNGNYFSSTTSSASLEFDVGFVIGAALGRALDNGFEYELELAYRKHTFGGRGSRASFFSSNGSYSLTGTLTSRFHVTTGTFGVIDVSTYLPSSTIPSYSPTGSSANFSGTFNNTMTSVAVRGISGDLTSWSIMANLWYDFCRGDDEVHYYIGGGLGWADVTMETGGINISDDGFAWQLAAGTGYDVREDTRVNLEVRYFTVPELSLEYFGRDIELDYEVLEVIVGLRRTF